MTDDDAALPSIEELEAQEWDVSGDKQELIEHEFMNGDEVQFLCQDPDEESILEFVMGGMGDESQRSQSQVTFDLVSTAIVAPEITMETWRGMRPADRMQLADKVAGATGIDRIMGFRDGGLEEQLDDLLSESVASGTSE